jgi:protein ImuB
LQLTLTRPYLPPIEKTVGLMRPCRDGAAMFKLLCYSLETLDQGGDGFTAIALRVRSSQRLGHEQVALLDGEAEKNDRELDHLIERLRARLDDPIQWGELVQSNLPECASRRRSELPLTPSPCTQGEGWGGGSVRPLCLLSQPRPIKVIVAPSESRDGRPISFTDNGAVHRLAHVRGPERITGQWWLGRLKIRDYFDALDTAGQRYWLFRVAQNGLWFLHGIFE